MTTKKKDNLSSTPFKLRSRKNGSSVKVQLDCKGESITKQSFKDDCDINKIMAKYVKTGILDHQREHGAEYGFATSEDFRESMEIVSKANSMFEELPSSIRSKFENKPEKFLEFVQDEKNLPEMQELGLANKTLKNREPDPATTHGETIIEQGTPRATGEDTSDAPASDPA